MAGSLLSTWTGVKSVIKISVLPNFMNTCPGSFIGLPEGLVEEHLSPEQPRKVPGQGCHKPVVALACTVEGALRVGDNWRVHGFLDILPSCIIITL